MGTYPTFLAGDVVVKLFGGFPGWDTSFATERAVHDRLATRPDVPAPRQVGHGRLFVDTEDSWPYLITERVGGTAWRDAVPTSEQAEQIACQLGQVIRVVHDLAAAPSGSADSLRPSVPGLPGDWAVANAGRSSPDSGSGAGWRQD